jgi:hypothetical protein
MEKNLNQNLFLQQFNESDAIAYSESFVSNNSDYNFQLLENAYRNTGKVYAKLKLAIDSNKCQDETCAYELMEIKHLQEAPQLSLDFLSSLLAELSVTEDPNFDPNNNFKYTVANSILNAKPGFSKSDGYNVYLDLLPGGSQQIAFTGPALVEPLVINNTALNALNESNTSLVAPTPDINKDMLRLLTEVGVFSPDMVGENGQLTAGAKITEEYVIMNPDGSFDYEIIDIGNGKGRNILKYDLDKIEKKVTPFINAEVAGLLSSEQEAVAAWNVYISKGTSVEEDDQMVQNANAAASSWSYTEDLPLAQDKKVLFEKKYKEYFMNNYLKQFTTNQLPTVQADAAVFDLAEAKKAKAQKFLKDNELN